MIFIVVFLREAIVCPTAKPRISCDHLSDYRNLLSGLPEVNDSWLNHLGQAESSKPGGCDGAASRDWRECPLQGSGGSSTITPKRRENWGVLRNLLARLTARLTAGSAFIFWQASSFED